MACSLRLAPKNDRFILASTECRSRGTLDESVCTPLTTLLLCVDTGDFVARLSSVQVHRAATSSGSKCHGVPIRVQACVRRYVRSIFESCGESSIQRGHNSTKSALALLPGSVAWLCGSPHWTHFKLLRQQYHPEMPASVWLATKTAAWERYDSPLFTCTFESRRERRSTS